MQGLLIPGLARIESVRDETAAGDVKTFTVEFLDEKNRFRYMPGQCAMLSVIGMGECMISITSSPTRDRMQFSVKRAGRVTAALHQLEAGHTVGIRGPYGNGFAVNEWRGKRLLFIAGGIGLAPLRSAINYCLDNRGDYGPIQIIYGARSPGDLCFKDEIFENWPGFPDTLVQVTVDKGDENWKGPEGFVPSFLRQVAPRPDCTVAVTCGPPVMIKFVLQALLELGFNDEQVVTTLELKMQCGVGKCGRCNIGDKYVCVDGPVFTLSQLRALPAEY